MDAIAEGWQPIDAKYAFEDEKQAYEAGGPEMVDLWIQGTSISEHEVARRAQQVRDLIPAPGCRSL